MILIIDPAASMLMLRAWALLQLLEYLLLDTPIDEVEQMKMSYSKIDS